VTGVQTCALPIFTAIITEKGILRPPYETSIGKMIEPGHLSG